MTGSPAKRSLGRPLSRLSERLRSSEATLAGVPHAVSNSVLYLSGAKCLLLESERANGEPVGTPVWFAAINDRVFLRTETGSAKVKRIKRRSVVKVAACTLRGTPINDYIECVARIVPPEHEPEAEAALRRQYGLARRLFSVLVRNEHTYIELKPLIAVRPLPGDEAQGAPARAIRQARHEHPSDAA